MVYGQKLAEQWMERYQQRQLLTIVQNGETGRCRSNTEVWEVDSFVRQNE